MQNVLASLIERGCPPKELRMTASPHLVHQQRFFLPDCQLPERAPFQLPKVRLHSLIESEIEHDKDEEDEQEEGGGGEDNSELSRRCP